MPLIPFAARPNSTSLSTSVCGAWSVAIASAVPSSSAARHAAASAADRSGGFTRSDDAYGAATIAPVVAPTGRRVASHAQRRAPASHSSVSARWCGVTSQVTGRPAAFARRTRSSAPAVERWVRCSRAPGHVADDVGEDREVAGDGRLLGRGGPAPQPEHRRDVARRSPRRPRSASGPRRGRRSAARARPRRRARSAGAAPTRTGAPSSENPTTPASASSPSAASVSPCPPGRDRAVRQQLAPATRRDRGRPHPGEHRRARRAPASCSASAQTVVNPPWAAAASPDATVSASSLPGSRKWAWRSMNPGATTTPPSSIPSASRAVEPRHRLEDPVRDDDLAGSLAARRRVDEPRPR